MRMIERAARALYEQFAADQMEEMAPWEKLGDKASWIDRARAAAKGMEYDDWDEHHAIAIGARFHVDSGAAIEILDAWIEAALSTHPNDIG